MFGPEMRADGVRSSVSASRAQEAADADREQATAGRSFELQRNLLRMVAGGSAILAALFISIVAVNDWHDRVATYATVAMRTACAVEEHALKVLQLNEALEQQVVDYLDGFDDGDFERLQPRIHAHLCAMALHIPSVVSIYVTNAQGAIVASSIAYPVPRVALTRQPYLRGAMAGRALDEVSPLFVGAISHERLFSTTARRTRADGGFDGIVSIALRPRYFTAFYRETAGVSPPWSLRLSRIDGAVLARYPPAVEAHAPAGTDAGSANGPAFAVDPVSDGGENAAALHALAAGKTAGLFTPRSVFDAGTGDAGTGVLAFRKVDGFPVFVSASVSLAAIRAEWLRHMGLLTASLLLPCLLLWSVIAWSLHRLARGERDWRELQAEVAVRKGVEEAYRQSLKMEALGRLVGNVAHEFNNLLMVVSANTQLVRFADAPKVAPQIAAIERAVRDGQSLTRQLLGVARKQPLRVEPIALYGWLAMQEQRLREVLGSVVVLSWTVPDACRVRVDPYEFELALTNVALNARDAMPAGGRFTIRAATRWCDGREAPSLQGEFVCITLRDTGIGMEPAVLSRAFEPLFSTKSKGRGMGLGLPQVFAFCEQAGGMARIESVPRDGTTVTLYLPRDTLPQPTQHAMQHVVPAVPMGQHATSALRPVVAAAVQPADPAAAVALRILLVEDDDAVAEANGALLATMGHTVQRAVTADAAMALFERGAASAIDVVVSDIQMPGAMNGIDLAERLAQVFPRLPVLLVTGYTRELERARQANRPVFSKPFDIVALDRMLRNIGARGTA
ncbi:response regulator [Robbsia sp. Bb-Pol-6]|uniref:histidine kinase n=1 Tax=Robbsia betulipollinis TaxID=2981849 RepID=A0ABT3ZND3_9BURK|nr:ATP-binding protein [Robbsia betulipollinis]MCY0387972.1 response regulator [Robbsia betulipollinis]